MPISTSSEPAPLTAGEVLGCAATGLVLLVGVAVALAELTHIHPHYTQVPAGVSQLHADPTRYTGRTVQTDGCLTRVDTTKDEPQPGHRTSNEPYHIHYLLTVGVGTSEVTVPAQLDSPSSLSTAGIHEGCHAYTGTWNGHQLQLQRQVYDSRDSN